MLMYKLEEQRDPTLVSRVAGLLYVLNEGFDDWAVGVPEVKECGMATISGGVVLKVKAWAERAC